MIGSLQMKTYNEWFIEAIERTKRLKLDTPITHLFEFMVSQPIPSWDRALFSNLEQHWCFHSRNMPFPPELRANACAMVHPVTLNQMYYGSLIENKAKTACLTIGTVVWDGDVCFDISEELLLSFLEQSQSNLKSAFPFHTWITKENLSILDLCFPCWQCVQNREPLDLRERGALKLFGMPDQIHQQIKIEFRPYLVGAMYLGRTESIAPETFRQHLQLEYAFVKHFSQKS